MSRLDCPEQVVGCVIDSQCDVSESFGIGGPKDYDFVKVILGFEGTLLMSATIVQNIS